ncbi:MAG: DUF6152 family protein [Pseudomonadota bacterium]
MRWADEPGRCYSRASVLLALVGIVAAAGAAAHHNSSGTYDFKSTLTVDATVTQVNWTNPHVYLFVNVADAEGRPVRWEVQAGGVGTLSRSGWTKDRFAIGSRLALTGHPSVRGEPAMLLVRAAAGAEATSTRIISAAAQRDPEQTASSLDGVWWTLLDSEQSVASFFPAPLQLTAKGRDVREGFDDKTEFPGLDCVPFIAPFSMILADLKRVHIEADRVRIVSEYDGEERIIWLRDDAPAAPAGLHGAATGRLTDNVLEAVTTNFAEHRVGNGWGLTSGPNRRLWERFALAADGKSLHYSFELSDPDYLAQPLRGDWTLVPRQDLTLTTTGCDLASAQRYLGHRP